MSSVLEYAKRNLLAATTRPEYLEYIRGNSYAEADPEHFLNVADLAKQLWERKYHMPAPEGFVIAGWYHDFDRVFPEKMVDTRRAENYEDAKAEHSRNCAVIFEEHNPELPVALIGDVKFLIERHEFGGEKGQDGQLLERPDVFTRSYNLNLGAEELCEADGLSFFPVILPSYAAWAPQDRVRQKIAFSYRKLSEVGKSIVMEIQFPGHLGDLVREVTG